MVNNMFCFWCKSGKVPKHLRSEGLVWIHLSCLEEIMYLKDDIQKVRELLEGREKKETVETFLKRMDNFDKYFNDIKKKMEIYKKQ